MKENSIEECIKRLEKSTEDMWFDFIYSQKDKDKDIQILLSDYKRVLKENELYRTVEKENKELKEKESRIYKEVQENLSFEKFLKKQKENIDEFNQGRFHVAQNIHNILCNVKSKEEKE